MNKHIIFLFILLFALSTNFSNAQIINKTSKQILLKGTVKDLIDDSPLSVNIKFEDENGKSFKITSNSLSGKYEQILEAGKTYKIKITANNIFPTEFIINTDTTNNYKEQLQDFKVVSLTPGKKVQCWDIFESGTSQLNSNFSNLINELNKNMQFNRNVSLILEVNAFDSFDKFIKISKVKGKSKKIDTVFYENDYNVLVKQRFENFKSQVSKLFKFPNRIEIKINLNVQLSEKSESCDVDLIVKEFKELLGE